MMPGMMGDQDEGEGMGGEGQEVKEGRGGGMLVGQGVHGVLDGSLTLGFFGDAPCGGISHSARGVVFAPALLHPSHHGERRRARGPAG